MISTAPHFLDTLKTIEIDFEFNNTAEPVLNLVCASLRLCDCGTILPIEEYWLHKQPTTYEELKLRLLQLNSEGYEVISHAAVAEARAFLALGLEPLDFKWLDTFLERRQLTNKCDKYSYGRYFVATPTGMEERRSQPPSFVKWKNVGKDNREIKGSLSDAVGFHLGVAVDTDHKTEMRDLVISSPEDFTPEQQRDIQAYCTSDIVYLRPLLQAEMECLEDATHMTQEMIYNAAIHRGNFAAATAHMESVGMPIRTDKVRNLIKNHEQAKNALIEDLNEKHYPFYEMRRKSDGTIGYTLSYNKYVQFLEENKLLFKFPKTDPTSRDPQGRYKMNKDTLVAYSHVPALKAINSVMEKINQLQWFQPKGSKDFFDRVGLDNRIRPYLNIYGTQTSRNAPPASQFILAMSNWLRALVEPPKGHVIIAKDWQSQEFAVAAALSGDKNMIEAYKSGDPYLYFAKLAKAVPHDADNKKCKAPNLCIPETIDGAPEGFDRWHMTTETESWLQKHHPAVWNEYNAYMSYSVQRGLFKATVLGLQYGMGVEKLLIKLILDTGLNLKLADATRLKNLHKRIFSDYWKWNECVVRTYKKQGYYMLWDGWCLLGDNNSDLSTGNFPVQGNASVPMKLACINMIKTGVGVICPLHDAVYAVCKEEDAERVSAIMDESMNAATREVLGDVLDVRIDTDIHKHGEVWVEGRGRSMYDLLSPFFEEQVTSHDTLQSLLNIYKGNTCG